MRRAVRGWGGWRNWGRGPGAPGGREGRGLASDTSSEQESPGSCEPEPVKNILIDKQGPITTLSINRYSKRNSLSLATLQELNSNLQQFDKDDEAKVLVLAGEGGTFCSGFDFSDVQEVGYQAMKDAAKPLLRRPLCTKVTICAMSGFAVAEGFDLALACDLRVIEDTACMGFLGRRFGATQSMDGGARLTSLIGLSRALDLTITGRVIPGTVADTWGLAARFVATGTALGQAVNLAMSIPKFPQNALLLDKLQCISSQLSDTSEDRARDEALAMAYAISDEQIREQTAKFQKGIGRHGKFYGLLEIPKKSWESEEGNVVCKPADDDSTKTA